MLLESIINNARNDSFVLTPTSIFEDYLEMSHLKERCDEIAMSIDFRNFLCESEQAPTINSASNKPEEAKTVKEKVAENKKKEKDKSLWKSFKDTVKLWFNKAKNFLVKIYNYVKTRIVKLYNLAKNQIVDTISINAINIADYKYIVSELKRISKAVLNGSKDNMDYIESLQKVKEKWSDMKENRKEILINKSQISQYRSLMEVMGGVIQDVGKSADKVSQQYKLDEAKLMKMKEEGNDPKALYNNTSTLVTVISDFNSTLLSDVNAILRAKAEKDSEDDDE